MVVGGSDRDHQFHPAGLILSTNETEDDFAFMFQTLAQGIVTAEGGSDPEEHDKWTPTFLISDDAPAIVNRFTRTLYPPQWVMEDLR